MSQAQEFDQVAEASATYAGFALAFSYPREGQGALSGAEYLAAFDPAASDQASSIHEAAYANSDSGALFEELVRYYEHFGLRRRQDAELPDHLGVELEFMHFLCELERHADAATADIESLRNAQRDFLDRHVLRLLKGLQQKRAGKDDRAGELLGACVDFVESHRQELSLQT